MEIKTERLVIREISHGEAKQISKLNDPRTVNEYRPCGGEVRFVVAWRGENDKEETAVLLPDLHFKKE